MFIFGEALKKWPRFGSTDVDRQLHIISITMILIVYISAGIYSVVENTMLEPNLYLVNSNKISNTIESFKSFGENCTTYDNSIYFLIVTLTNVGYGDIEPETFPGKLIVIFIIIITIVIIPK